MKFRDYKNFRENGYYHLYSRGHNKENIFRDPQDYQQFLKRLRAGLGLPYDGRPLQIQPVPSKSFFIIAYCLMTNHFHIQIKQNTKINVDRLITKILTSYAMYFNRKYDRLGSVFQSKFNAKVITTEEYAIELSAYIHNNPPRPFEYAYSSLPEYLEDTENPLCDTSIIMHHFANNRVTYKQFVIQNRKTRTVLDSGVI